MPRAPRFQLMIVPSVVTPVMASRETSTMSCNVESSSLTPVSCSSVPLQVFHTAALAAIWITNSGTMNFQLNSAGAKKQITSTVGITIIGRGHNLRVTWEMDESLLESIAWKLSGRVFKVAVGRHPHFREDRHIS